MSLINESVNESGELRSQTIESASKPGRMLGQPLSRRRFLQMCGGATVAAMIPGIALGGGKTVSAAIPTTQRFRLAGPGGYLFLEKPLQNVSVMQSFAFDNQNKHVYTVQRRDGYQPEAGNLTVTKMSLSGTILGHMYLMGFGHGVSIGVEPVGTSAYLWTETDCTANGWGTKICRFQFVNGATRTNTHSSLTKYTVPGPASSYTCDLDLYHGNIVVRYRDGTGNPKFDVYNLAAFKAGDRTPLASVYQPSGIGVFQGYAVYGSFLYLYEGTPYSASNPSPGNTYIKTVNLNTGAQINQLLTTAGGSMTYREPEGMSIQMTNPNNFSTARLAFGFATGPGGNRKASIFYKSELI